MKNVATAAHSAPTSHKYWATGCMWCVALRKQSQIPIFEGFKSGRTKQSDRGLSDLKSGEDKQRERGLIERKKVAK